MYRHLHRLPIYWQATPLFFITTTTFRRQSILAHQITATILLEEWHQALIRHGWRVGWFVVMPDHVHFLCMPAEAQARSLSRFMQAWKQWTSKRLIRECGITPPVWQPEFYDHVIHSNKIAVKVGDYISSNPVRAGLVKKADDWPWRGEIHSLW